MRNGQTPQNLSTVPDDIVGHSMQSTPTSSTALPFDILLSGKLLRTLGIIRRP